MTSRVTALWLLAETVNPSLKELLRALEKVFSERRVFFAKKRSELLQFRALLIIESCRDFHHDADKKITVLASVDVNDAFAPKFKHLAALCARRNFQIGFGFQRWHGHFAAERGQRKWNWDLAVEIILVALENLMLLNVDDDVKIALRTAANASLAVARRTKP